VQKNVFSLKMIVIYLTIKSSFPRTQKQQLTHSLKTQTSLLESGSMSEERPHVCRLFVPTELYVGLIKKMAKYEIGKSSAILDSLNEDLYNQGFIDDATYQKFKEAYMKKLVEVVREREKSSVEVEVTSAKFEVQKNSTVEVRRYIDYSKFSDDQLLEAYRKASLTDDVVGVQLIQGEAKRRGYRFKADDNGNVKVISLLSS